MKALFYISAVFAAAGFAVSASADTIELKTGDVFTGKLIGIEDGAVTFMTTLSGQMMVPLHQTVSLVTDADWAVTVEGKEPVVARFTTREGKEYLSVTDSIVSEPVELTAIARAVPLKKPPREGASREEPGTALHSALETGVQWRSGNRDYADLFARLNLWRITEPYSYLSTFMLERADTDEFPRWLRAETLWELDPAGAVHPMAALEIERDTDAALALRGSLSLGVAKTLFESDADRLSANAGIGGTVERYDAGLFDDGVRPTRRGEESARTDLHARLQLRYAHALFGNGEFSSALGLYPTLTGFDDFRARSESALLFPFTPRLKMKFNVLVDYESAPELSGFDHWRTSVGASLLWDF